MNALDKAASIAGCIALALASGALVIVACFLAYYCGAALALPQSCLTLDNWTRYTDECRADVKAGR